MQKIRKELKVNWQSCSFLWAGLISLFLYGCSKKINPYKNFSQQQCIAHALNSQKKYSDLHGELKVSLPTQDNEKINLLAGFQLNQQGKMMLSVDKLGFNIALAIINQEYMYLWQSKQQNFWQGLVSEGLGQILTVPLSMKDIVQFFYIDWDSEEVSNIYDHRKYISFEVGSVKHWVSKKTCALYQSEIYKDDLVIHIKKYIKLPSKKMLPKLIDLNYQDKKVQLTLNQVFEQALNDKKWEKFKKSFLKTLEKKPMSIE
ncbi:hypothetical protein MRY82_01620 [bacterium]|nr:hypothetical protein [bacterium]